MNELVQMIVQKTGLTQDKVQMVVDLVVTHLKEKLPGSVGSHLDSFLSTGGVATTAGGVAEKAKSVVAGLSSVFGTKDA
ncbi:MAG: hypothetical protein LAO19_08515 [Acidobacteriia bacterium]|nr:hypothetical protein [Terriglobia bacterium]